MVDQAILLIGSGLFPAEGMKVTAVSGRVTVGPDNRIQSHTMRMSVQIDLGGPVLEASAERIFRYRNVGGPVSVEFPGGSGILRTGRMREVHAVQNRSVCGSAQRHVSDSARMQKRFLRKLPTRKDESL